MRQKIIHYAAILANVIMLGFALVLFTQSYGSQRGLPLLLCIPAILSLMTIFQGPDKEERSLIKRLRKANLRKELKSLSEFDS